MSAPATNAAAGQATSKFARFMASDARGQSSSGRQWQRQWGLVAAGLKDLSRPAEKLSVSQNVALAATGFIWVRYSFVITPVNYSLDAVNFFVGSTGLGQLYRIWDYRRSNPDAAKVADLAHSK